MTEAYRQKLLNWYLSMLMLALASVSSLSGFLLIGRLNPQVENDTNDPFVLPAIAGGTLIVFATYFVPVASWHLFDFIQKGTPANRTLGILAGYRAFGTILVLGSFGLAAITSQILTMPKCPPLEVGDGAFGFVGCDSGPPDWLLASSYILLLFALILCMGKAVIAIRSRLKKAI